VSYRVHKRKTELKTILPSLSRAVISTGNEHKQQTVGFISYLMRGFHPSQQT